MYRNIKSFVLELCKTSVEKDFSLNSLDLNLVDLM